MNGGWKHSCGTELHTSCGSYCAWKQRDSTAQAGNLETVAGGGTERGRYSYGRGRRANPSIAEMARNTELDSGVPEQQMTTYQRRNSTQKGTRWQQGQRTAKFSGLAYKMNSRWRKTNWKELNCERGWGGGVGEWACKPNRWAVNNLDETWTFQSEQLTCSH